MNLKKLQKSLSLQHDQTDCGVACLQTLVRYYGGDINLERLRELSGTSRTGTTLLGLYQVANQIGFIAEGCEADIPALIEHNQAVILHLTLQNQYQHYVVAAPKPPSPRRGNLITPLSVGEGQGVRFIIADPAQGVYEYSAEELDKVWLSKKCLTLEPNQHFISAKQDRQTRWQWLWSLIQPDLNILGVSAVLGVVLAVLGLVMAIFSQKLIDDILPKGNQNKLLLGTVLVTLLLLIRLGLGALRQFLLNRQGQDFNNRLIDSFYSKLLFLPKSFFDTRKIGDLTARLQDVNRIQRVINQVLNNLVIDSLAILVSIAFLFSYQWQVGLVALLSLPIFFALLYQFNQPILQAQKAAMIAHAQTESNYIDTMQGIAEIKVLNEQNNFRERNQLIYGHLQTQIFNLGTLSIRLNLVIGFLSVLFLVGILIYASQLALNQQIKLGELTAILAISGNLLPSIVNLALLFVPIQEAQVAFNRMYEFASLKPETENLSPAENKFENLDFENLKIQNLSFRFPGQPTLLKEINLTIQKGEIVAILGESGKGKSTLLQILQKFYNPESGEILLNNHTQWTDIQVVDWRSIVGVVPQSIKIFNGTLLENISLGKDIENPQAIIDFCQKTGFHSYFTNFPQTYQTIVGEGGINLSGGQQQLVALARALYRQPQLLLLDEATSAMDKKTEGFVLDLLQKLKSQMAILFITHKSDLLSLVDQVHCLENKQLFSVGSTVGLSK
jgi:ATP-binding cassette, subfamily C, bacteriocin exporter